MHHFIIRPTREVLIRGRKINPTNDLARIELLDDFSVHELLHLIRSQYAELVEAQSVASRKGASKSQQASPNPDLDSGEPSNIFDEAGFSAKVVASLAAAGVTDLDSALAYCEQHGDTFVELDDIGSGTDKKLIDFLEQLVADGDEADDA